MSYAEMVEALKVMAARAEKAEQQLAALKSVSLELVQSRDTCACSEAITAEMAVRATLASIEAAS